MSQSHSIALFLSFLCLSLCTTAGATLPEAWTVLGAEVRPSEYVRSDGERVQANPAEEVALALSLQTQRTYGSPGGRRIKSSIVQAPTAEGLGEIKIEIESSAELECNPDGSGGLAMMAPHSAELTAVVRPGVGYRLIVNNFAMGTFLIDQQAAQFAADPGYAAAIEEFVQSRFASVFGSGLFEIQGEQCTVTGRNVEGRIVLNYNFPSVSETLPNGDTLIHRQVTGEVQLQPFAFTPRSYCRDGVPRFLGYQAVARPESSASLRDVEYRLSTRNQDGVVGDEIGRVIGVFEIGDRSCSQTFSSTSP